MPRPLPTPDEAARILAVKRTRPIRRAPPAVGRSLNGLVKALDARFGQGTGALTTRWREIVGETLARRTEPVKLTKPRDGAGATLEIRVAGPVATLVQHQAQDIMARVNLILGAGAVRKLRIIQGPLTVGVGGKAPLARRRAPPLDAAQEARLAADLADAPDGPLKTALMSLGRAVLRQSTR